MKRHSEAPYRHGEVCNTTVMLVNLGTPDAPTPGAVRRYLQEFLSDPRVVEIPRGVWLPILHGIILRTRPAKSAQKYASVWTPEGSPLMKHSVAQAESLQRELSARGFSVDVVLAMRYGNPSIPEVMKRLRERHCERLMLIPMYPQYSATTTATVFDAVFREVTACRNPPEIRTLKHFHDDRGYIAAVAQKVREHWRQVGEPDFVSGDRVLMSFHGVPKRTLTLGDPYHCECLKTARLVAQTLQLPKEAWSVSFQSRFGRAEWLQPYTEPTLKQWAKEGVKRVDVFCPGFVADCLETLEEIQMEAKEAFLTGGGTRFEYIPCVNASQAFTSSMADLLEGHLKGWPVRADEIREIRHDRSNQIERALAMGAKS